MTMTGNEDTNVGPTRYYMLAPIASAPTIRDDLDDYDLGCSTVLL